MKSLLLVAHGSRRAESNDEVRQLALQLEASANGQFDQIACAFLELAEPSIPDGLRAAIRAGATEVTVLPYFLSAGRHVVTDIPGEVNIIRAESPEVKIILAPYLGASPAVVDLLLGLATGEAVTGN
jgi:sirohydrochlorin ferrochelatase